MAGHGPTPKPQEQRRRRNKPSRGEWKATPGIGWQHGAVPEPPDGLTEPSRKAWGAWMSSWVAAHWLEADLPVLRQLIRLFDVVERGASRATFRSELRLLMDSYSITPKGRADRHWTAPKEIEDPQSAPSPRSSKPSRFAHLKVVNE